MKTQIFSGLYLVQHQNTSRHQLAQLILNAPSKLSGVLQLKGNTDYQARSLYSIYTISI